MVHRCAGPWDLARLPGLAAASPALMLMHPRLGPAAVLLAVVFVSQWAVPAVSSAHRGRVAHEPLETTGCHLNDEGYLSTVIGRSTVREEFVSKRNVHACSPGRRARSLRLCSSCEDRALFEPQNISGGRSELCGFPACVCTEGGMGDAAIATASGGCAGGCAIVACGCCFARFASACCALLVARRCAR